MVGPGLPSLQLPWNLTRSTDDGPSLKREGLCGFQYQFQEKVKPKALSHCKCVVGKRTPHSIVAERAVTPNRRCFRQFDHVGLLLLSKWKSLEPRVAPAPKRS